MEKANIRLEGLTCANCAGKIEDRTKKIVGLEKVNYDFSQTQLTFFYDSEHVNINHVFDHIKKIVKELEPDVAVILQSEDSTSFESSPRAKQNHVKKELIRLGLSLSFFTLGILAPQLTLKIALLGTAYVLSGYKVLYKSFRNIVRGQVFDENFLMTLATFGAIAIGEYPEAVAVMIFYEIGEFFEELAVDHSRNSIKALMDIKPDQALLLVDGVPKTVKPEEVPLHSKILIRPGMRVPLDGIILEGTSMVDTASLTGESMPRNYAVGDAILSGSVVINGLLTVQVTALFKDSTVSRILDLVENASAHKAKTEHFITKFARVYTPIVVGLAVLIAIIPPLVIEDALFNDWLYRSLIFLVISCPCALVLSVPLGFFSGIGAASKHGILVKGSNYLELLTQVDTIVFDKTGTLTQGNFKVSQMKAIHENNSQKLKEIAHLCESQSTHPIAKSIVSYIESTGYTPLFTTPYTFEEISGKGVVVKQGGQTYIAGNQALVESMHLQIALNSALNSALDSIIDSSVASSVNSSITSPIASSVRELSGTLVYVFENDQLLGYIQLNDQIKKDALQAIQGLKHLKKDILMLTGDREHAALEVASQLGIDHYKSELLPLDKYNAVNDLILAGKKVAFVGDGINDAPVLTLAHVGLSMGSIGSDVAIEASDIVIMKDEPSKLIPAFAISKKTHNIVIQNIVFALGIKIIIMILGVVGLSSMWMAIFGDVGVALLAILNATRILSAKY